MARNTRRGDDAGSNYLLAGRIILRIVLYIAIVVVLVFAARFAYHLGYSVFHSEPMASEPGQDVVVTVTGDMSDQEVGRLLESKGLIEDGYIFVIQSKIYDYEIYAGTYVLNTSETVSEMVEIMSVEPETAAFSLTDGSEAAEETEEESAE